MSQPVREEASAALRPSVSVVVPTYQRCASLQRLLSALCRQDLPADDFEVIVVVDGSEDGSFEMARSFSAGYRLQVLRQRNLGRATACNAGIHAAEGEVIVLLDDDMEPEPGCLTAHLDAHAEGGPRCVVGAAPMTLAPEASPSARYIARKFNEHLERIARPGRPFELWDFYSGNSSLPRDVLLQIGAFDDRFRLYGNEDLDLSLRLRDAGVEVVFHPAARAVQHHSKDFAQLATDAQAAGRTAVQLAAHRPDAFSGLQLGLDYVGSRLWRPVRSLLLVCARRWAGVPRLVIAATERLERRRLRRVTLYYRHVLDFFYWMGARDAMREPWAESVRRMVRRAR